MSNYIYFLLIYDDFICRTLFLTGTYLTGQDDRGRMIRRTVARYMLFALILILRSISVAVMKRYPTMEHIVDAGFPLYPMYDVPLGPS